MIWKVTLFLILISHQILGNAADLPSMDEDRIGKLEESLNNNSDIDKMVQDLKKDEKIEHSKIFKKYAIYSQLQKGFDKLPIEQKLQFLEENYRDIQSILNTDNSNQKFGTTKKTKVKDDSVQQFVGFILLSAMIIIFIYYLLYIFFDCLTSPVAPSSQAHSNTIIQRGPSTIHPPPPPPPTYSNTIKYPPTKQ